MSTVEQIPKRVVITGGSGEIGRAIAAELAQDGAQVLFTYFSNHDGAEETRAAIESAGGAAFVERVHLGKEPSIGRLMEVVSSTLGGVDIFIHNAASGVLKPVTELSKRHWDWTHQINVRSFFFLAQAMVKDPALMGSGGRMLALSSLGSIRAIPQYAAVGTSKAALESGARHLAAELGPLGITVNVISPGVIDTWSLKQFPNREQLLEIASLRTPTGRLATAVDVAKVARFLCSEDAAMINGQTLNIDGGYSILS